MANQKGSLKDKLLSYKLFKFNLKRKKELAKFKKKKHEEELLIFRNTLKLKKPIDTIQNTNIINIEKSQNQSIEVIKKSVLIDKTTNIGVKQLENQENPKETVVINKIQYDSLKKGINQEIENNKIEKKIIKKIDKVIFNIKEDLKEAENIVDSIKEEEKSITEKDVAQKEKRLEKVTEKIEQSKEKITKIEKNTDFVDFDLINDSILLEQLSDYKIILSNDDKVNDLSNECKINLKKVDFIESIIYQKDKVKNELTEEKNKIQARDTDFDNYQNKVKISDELNDKVAQSIYNNQQKLKEFEDSLKHLNYQEKQKARPDLIDVISYNVLKISMLVAGVKKSKISLILGSLYINKLFNPKELEKKKNRKIVNEREKLDNQLSNNLKDMDYITSNLKEAKYSIKNLKQYFLKEFEEYKNHIPEYEKIYNRLSCSENLINNKIEELKKQEYQINKNKEKNKIKTKKLS